MRFRSISAVIAFCLALTGCAATQEVTVAKSTPIRSLSNVAVMNQDGNSNDVTNAVEKAFTDHKIGIKPQLPAGTRQSDNVDAIVSYSDVWRWDLVMYLKSITIDLYDAKTGDLLVNGRWENSDMHGFQDYKQVVQALVDEMLTKAHLQR